MAEFKKLVCKNSNGRNCYSILYFDETDGEIHKGFSSGNLDVISYFLKEIFINNNAERHAHWNDISINSNAKRIDICSCCKAAINRDIDSDKYNYCPTCGAKMDEVADKDMKGKE